MATKKIVIGIGFRSLSPFLHHCHYFLRPPTLPSEEQTFSGSNIFISTPTSQRQQQRLSQTGRRIIKRIDTNHQRYPSSSLNMDNSNNNNSNDDKSVNQIKGNENNSNGGESDVSTEEESTENLKLVQDQQELFDLYIEPPPQSSSSSSTSSYYYHNKIVTPEWGNQYYPIPQKKLYHLSRQVQTKGRGLVHRDGDWHRSIDVWVVEKKISSSVNVLLQRRSKYKDTHPNLLDVSCAGHVNSGDDTSETLLRELYEELGIGNNSINNGNDTDTSSSSSSLVFLSGNNQNKIQQNHKIFTIASSIEGSTIKYGKFICREYQDVYVLWWNDDIILKSNYSKSTTATTKTKTTIKMEPNLFQPMIKEEVSGFEIIDGSELIQRLRNNDKKLVPRSIEYINALEKAIII